MSTTGMVYALYERSNIKLMTSNELVVKYPEALVCFLEGQVQFNWPQRDALVNSSNNNMLINRYYISACSNQGDQGMKYILSRGGAEHLRVMSSQLLVEQAPNLIVEFLESKMDLSDCNFGPKMKHRKYLP